MERKVSKTGKSRESADSPFNLPPLSKRSLIGETSLSRYAEARPVPPAERGPAHREQRS